MARELTFAEKLIDAIFDGYGPLLSREFDVALSTLEAWSDGAGEPPHPIKKKLLEEWLDRKPRNEETRDVARGWWGIVDDAIDKLKTANVEIQRVKQKIGGLRIYFAPYDRELDDVVVGHAAHKCAETCEICGAPGTKDTRRYWIMTVCERCASEREPD
jgi:hypothetical protein